MKRFERLFRFLCLGCVIAGGIITVLGWQEKQLFDKGTPQPEPITLAALTAKPSIDNVHLTITEFDWGTGYVYEEKKGTWQIVWIPLVPPDLEKDGKPTDKPNVRVVIKSFKVKNEAEVEALARNLQVTGVITNDIHSMGSAAARELNRMYPAVDFSKAIVLEDRRTFPTEDRVNLSLYGGLGLVVLGGFFGFLWMYASRQTY